MVHQVFLHVTWSYCLPITKGRTTHVIFMVFPMRFNNIYINIYIYIYFFIVIHNHYNNVFRAVTGKENSAYKRRKKNNKCIQFGVQYI